MLLYIIPVILFSACGQKTENADTSEPTVVEQSPPEAQFVSIPQEMVMKIWNEVDMLDYIFHLLPFSMSQDDQNSIRTNVTYIGKDPQPYIPEGCKPLARQFYQTEGDIFLEADIYFDEHCKFYVFFVDGEAKYANKMSPEGISFFQTMIRKAINTSQDIGQ